MCCSQLTEIPSSIANDEEMLSWLEEQMARVTHESFLALQETDEEDHQWACF